MATKQTETTLSNRLPNEQYTKLADIAARDGRSVAELLAEIVEDYVETYEPTGDTHRNGEDAETNDDAEASVAGAEVSDDDADETEERLHPQTRVGRHSSYF